jgi:ribonuclease-3
LSRRDKPTKHLEELETALGHSFGDRSLLKRALTHSSSVNELQAPGSTPLSGSKDNERLEFLGDSILGWLVSEWLFQRFPDFTEGQLSLVKNHLVSATHLLDASNQLELGRHLELGRGEETAGGRGKHRLLVNAFEAVLAAVYLDGGVDVARKLIARYALPDDDAVMVMAGAGPPLDFRAELERLARDRSLGKPLYSLLGESGPGHARKFLVEVRAGKDFVASAEGSSKKVASHNAAREVCRLIRES